MSKRRGPPVVHTQNVFLPDAAFPLFSNFQIIQFGPNDSSIKRGDREDTGDNEARPDEMGTGEAQGTVDPTSFGGSTSIRHPSSDRFDPAEELGDLDGMETMMPTDGRLGLTNVGNVPAEDWAADTGPTRTPEENENR